MFMYFFRLMCYFGDGHYKDESYNGTNEVRGFKSLVEWEEYLNAAAVATAAAASQCTKRTLRYLHNREEWATLDHLVASTTTIG